MVPTLVVHIIWRFIHGANMVDMAGFKPYVLMQVGGPQSAIVPLCRLTWTLNISLWRLWRTIFLYKPVVLRVHVDPLL